MADGTFKVLGICGSLRKSSFNLAMLRAAQELAPDGMELTIADISKLPLFNDDLDQAGAPSEVQTLRDQIRAADAILFATPEYNYNLPGPLKNAIDWASRPPPNPALSHKPVAIMGASVGIGATIRAQLALRQCMLYLNCYDLPKPEVFVPRAAEKFDEGLRLVDQPTRDVIRQMLESLIPWAKRFQ